MQDNQLKHRTILKEAYNETRHITLFGCDRSLSHWYELDTFIMESPTSLSNSRTSTREYPYLSDAFDRFDTQVKIHNLTILEKKEA